MNGLKITVEVIHTREGYKGQVLIDGDIVWEADGAAGTPNAAHEEARYVVVDKLGAFFRGEPDPYADEETTS